jgi:hypothetical protein
MVYCGRRGTDPVLTSEQDGHWLDTRLAALLVTQHPLLKKVTGARGRSGHASEHNSHCPYRETIPVQFYQTTLTLQFRPDKFHRGTSLIGDVFISYDRWNI